MKRTLEIEMERAAMGIANPTGIPCLDREEPELAIEEDIPTPSNEDLEEAARNTEIAPRQP